MQSFILMDGAMVYAVLNASRSFTDPQVPWLAPILLDQQARLAGPLLIDRSHIPKQSPDERDLRRASDAYPHQLHISILQSEWELHALRDHLRCFACFTDESGDTYGLRIADARVLACLPGIFTPVQWNALTSPLASWQVKDRCGVVCELPLDEARHEFTAAPEPLHLSQAQIDQLMQAGEPDALLDQVALAPDLEKARFTQGNYDTACLCIRHWQDSGNTSRAVLAEFGRRVFATGAGNRNDAGWMKGQLQEVLSAPRPASRARA